MRRKRMGVRRAGRMRLSRHRVNSRVHARHSRDAPGGSERLGVDRMRRQQGERGFRRGAGSTARLALSVRSAWQSAASVPPSLFVLSALAANFHTPRTRERNG